MTGASKIPLATQAAAVRDSATMAHASADYHKDRDGAAYQLMKSRAGALEAAAVTLAWLRDNAEAVRATARKEGRERRRFADLPLAQQAAMRCNDAGFQKFMRAEDADGAARAVRSACRVESRREFDTVPEAGSAWRRLDAEFEAWLRGIDSGEVT